MESITVSEALIRDVISVAQTDTVKDVGLKIKSTNHRGFPVLDREGKLIGIVTRKDINKALNEGKSLTEVRNVMTKNVTVCYPDESLKTALHKMAEKNIGRMPVVKREDQEHIIGLITRKSLMNAYNQALEITSLKFQDKTLQAQQ